MTFCKSWKSALKTKQEMNTWMVFCAGDQQMSPCIIIIKGKNDFLTLFEDEMMYVIYWIDVYMHHVVSQSSKNNYCKNSCSAMSIKDTWYTWFGFWHCSLSAKNQCISLRICLECCTCMQRILESILLSISVCKNLKIIIFLPSGILKSMISDFNGLIP